MPVQPVARPLSASSSSARDSCSCSSSDKGTHGADTQGIFIKQQQAIFIRRCRGGALQIKDSTVGQRFLLCPICSGASGGGGVGATQSTSGRWESRSPCHEDGCCSFFFLFFFYSSSLASCSRVFRILCKSLCRPQSS